MTRTILITGAAAGFGGASGPAGYTTAGRYGGRGEGRRVADSRAREDGQALRDAEDAARLLVARFQVDGDHEVVREPKRQSRQRLADG